jgi:hypothetical protein
MVFPYTFGKKPAESVLFIQIQNKLTMKNSIILFSIVALLFIGCGNKNTGEHSHDGEDAHEHGTHQHEDGTTHDNHDEENHQQEEFKVSPDSTSMDTTSHSHGEEGDHKH